VNVDKEFGKRMTKANEAMKHYLENTEV